jgi:hypothetical protein
MAHNQATLGTIAPYFRFPFFHTSADVEEYLASRGIMSWGADVVPEDWTDITPKQLVKRVLSGLETTRGDGKLIRVISARAMHRRERLHYEQEA